MWAAMAAAAALGAAADVDRLGWMAGAWRQEKDGVITREIWQTPLGGAMGGVGQTIRPGAPPQIEFMKITAEPAGATFTAAPEGQTPIAFVLKSSAEEEAVFENLAHDFPQRVIYRRCGSDLCARIEGVVDGAVRGVDWRYSPAP